VKIFEKAKYYPEDAKFLLSLKRKVNHHEVFADIQNNEESFILPPF